MAKKYVRMAIAYDFDGTLAPGNMQEHQFLPDIGMKPAAFWSEVKRVTREHQADEVLVYMNLMLKKAASAEVPVRRENFKNHGQQIKLFDGVIGWFDRITEYARIREIRVDHFLISSGNAEIFAGTPISSKFTQVYASKFIFNQNGVADWPALAVNYTTKTQYLFRINKDAHDLSDNSEVNRFVAKQDRPVPFENMIFIGDGSTDIPCFRLVKEQGGLSIAVYKPHTVGAKGKADAYKNDGRVHCVAPAVHEDGSRIDRIVKAQIDLIASRSAAQVTRADD
ncbi:HAD family hydrolase [Kaistia geumhonensis]|uniref:Phosphoserine phosphatase n=1 Tax=Kaistia geumhonensis TaxID=410839 RepID=A0ABU0M298_9HYPH|nr:HAD family hydrolase [Kaistia geumhonensis]MCX5479697.1 HAD family hydrolase [Kaistia geumhonensis]MDQ0515079.1 phosphoserine phosphatase [Kaistia geumhonensis]